MSLAKKCSLASGLGSRSMRHRTYISTNRSAPIITVAIPNNEHLKALCTDLYWNPHACRGYRADLHAGFALRRAFPCWRGSVQNLPPQGIRGAIEDRTCPGAAAVDAY